MDFVETPWMAARLWQAAAFGGITGLLLWTVGLARGHGGLTSAAALIAVFTAAGWGPALLLAVALGAAGVACRVAGVGDGPPAVPVRLGVGGVAALAGMAIVVTWAGWWRGDSAVAATAFVGAVAGGTAVWWHRALPGGTGDLAHPAALTAASGLAAAAWWLGLLGPGDGILPVIGAALAVPVSRSIRGGPRREILLGSVLAALIARLLVALLP